MPRKRKGNGWDEATFGVLVEIRDEMRSGFGRVDARLTRVEHELVEVKGELVKVNRRIDGVLKMAGERYRDHDRRLLAVEKQLARLAKS